MPKIKMMMKKFGRVIFELSISKLGKLGYMEIFMKNYPLFKRFLTNQGKNKNEDEKIWKNESDFRILHENEDEKIWKNEFGFWIFHIKIKLYRNFHENLRKIKFDPFLKTFMTNRGKSENEDEKYGKMSPLFELSISKVSYVELFIKIWGKGCFRNVH